MPAISPMTEVGYTDRHVQPYLNVGLLIATWADGTKSLSTASLVGRNDILTASHSVYNPDKSGWAVAFDFYFGTDYNITTGVFESVTYHVDYTQWDGITWPEKSFADQNNEMFYTSESQYDIALIGIDTPIGDELGWLGLNPGLDSNVDALAVGYPTGSTGMMEQTVSVSRDRVYTVYDSGQDIMGPGSSGGPLLVGNQVIGVKSTGSWWADIGGGLYADIVDELHNNDYLINAAPTDINLDSFSVSENVPESLVAHITGTDPDDDALTFSVVGGDDAAMFEVRGDALYLASGRSADYETKRVLQVTIQAKDIFDAVYSETVNIRVIDTFDLLSGTEGNDTLGGFAGNDLIDGGAGIDRVVYDTTSDSVTFSKNASAQVVVQGESGQSEAIASVERLQFNDISYALDIDGNARIAVDAVIASFGAEGLDTYMAPALALVDQGWTMADLCNLVIDHGLVPSGNAEFVDVVYRNVVGAAPTPAERALYTGYLDEGVYTQASLLEFAANAPSTQSQLSGHLVNLTGLPDAELLALQYAVI